VIAKLVLLNIVIENVADEVDGGVTESETVITTLAEVAGVEGYPESVPSVERVRPVGNPLADQ
jgi:hypothetical protein